MPKPKQRASESDRQENRHLREKNMDHKPNCQEKEQSTGKEEGRVHKKLNLL
jgi:hypothetical protein